MNKTLKIYLADLVHSIPGNYVVPLNIGYLSAYSKSIFKDELDVSLFKSPNALLEAIKKESPDILGFSNYSWNYDLNYQIGSHVKSLYPDTSIIMGGCGIRTDNEGIKSFLQRNSYVDVYMMFEGEEPFTNFIYSVIELRKKWRYDFKKIKGCAYIGQDRELIYAPCEPILDLEKIPSVYLGGYLDDFLKQGLIPLIETNRGCPFSCTYCAWGIAARKKIRKFPLERVYEEIDYIVKSKIVSPSWIFADANFGLFNRDELIAEKIRKIREANNSLQRVFVYTSHNRNDVNLRVAEKLGILGTQLIAVQSFDPIVQKNIKRTNIKDSDVPKIIKQANDIGVKTSVDILLGLPGETKESHLNTLRKCFELGFDIIDVLNIRMLPGSVLEMDEQRQKYSIKTKYRLIQGSYGIYQGIKSLEAEEGIRSTSTMSEEDIVFFRLVHWLVWFGWNTQFLAPLLKMLSYQGVNPIELIIKIVDGDKKSFPLVNNLFDRFKQNAQEEWFETYDDLRKYYLEGHHFNELLNGSFSKLNFKYMAEMILNHPTYLSFLEYIKDIITKSFPSCSIPSDIFRVMSENIIDAEEIRKIGKIREKTLAVCSDILPFIVPNGKVIEEYKEQKVILFFSKDDGYVKTIRELYDKFGYNKNKHLAIEKILEQFIDGFSYNISIGDK